MKEQSYRLLRTGVENLGVWKRSRRVGTRCVCQPAASNMHLSYWERVREYFGLETKPIRRRK